MNISIFDVTGPVMIGPSSSHTAGAARLSRVAAMIVNAPFRHVSFGLHGSFAKTYRGHGTDKALVAGVLGLRADDERLKDAFILAEEAGLTYDFYEIELEGMHDNSVSVDFVVADGKTHRIVGSSTGGGQIVIRRIDGIEVELSANAPTLIIRQLDKKGVISEVTKVLADQDINIGVMKVSRTSKGETALCIIETDSVITESVTRNICEHKYVIDVQALNIEP